MMPIDDTHFRVYGARRLSGEPPRSKMARGSWADMTPEEKRAHPGDYEAQSGQGTITLHSEDHLAATDRGVAMLRKRYRQQVEVVASGGDPEGLGYNEADALIEFESGTSSKNKPWAISRSGREPRERLRSQCSAIGR